MSKPTPTPLWARAGPPRPLSGTSKSNVFPSDLASTENENGGKNLFPFGPKIFFYKSAYIPASHIWFNYFCNTYLGDLKISQLIQRCLHFIWKLVGAIQFQSEPAWPSSLWQCHKEIVATLSVPVKVETSIIGPSGTFAFVQEISLWPASVSPCSARLRINGHPVGSNFIHMSKIDLFKCLRHILDQSWPLKSVKINFQKKRFCLLFRMRAKMVAANSKHMSTFEK